MNPKIAALATATPKYAYNQKLVGEKMSLALKLDNQRTALLQRLYSNTRIDQRYSVLQDSWEENDSFFFRCFSNQVPGMSERTEIYKKEAPRLALQASQEALLQWGKDPKSLTHIISVSCTGSVTPGIEFLVAKKLNLCPYISRLGINMMGCFGAFKGLEMASEICRANSKHKVLLLCTELCSLHMQSDSQEETLVSNALFADGAASAIVEMGSAKEKGLYSIQKTASFSLDDSLDLMGWDASDSGMKITLSKKVVEHIERSTPLFLQKLAASWQINPKECTFAIHPGGKAIVQALEKSLELHSSQTAPSWEVLKKYGNMSSATFLFLLKHMLQQKLYAPLCVGLGFGPGLSIEANLLKKEAD
jgi:predicted naringenin-chalcone synthase